MTNQHGFGNNELIDVVLPLNGNSYGFNYTGGREWGTPVRISSTTVHCLKKGDVILCIDGVNVADSFRETIRERIQKAKLRDDKTLRLQIMRTGYAAAQPAYTRFFMAPQQITTDYQLLQQLIYTDHHLVVQLEPCNSYIDHHMLPQQIHTQPCLLPQPVGAEYQDNIHRHKILSYTDGEKCAYHPHWKTCCQLSNGRGICLECVRDEHSSDKTYIKNFVHSNIADHQFPLYYHGVSYLRRDEYCKIHLNWKIVCELPCSSKICFMCIVDEEENACKTFTDGYSQIRFKMCNACKTNVLLENYLEEMTVTLRRNATQTKGLFLNNLIKPITSNQKKPCNVHKHFPMNYKLPCCQRVCIRCLVDRYQQGTLTKTVLSTSCSVISCPSCEQTLPGETIKELLNDTIMIQLDHMPVEMTLNGNVCKRHKHWKTSVLLPCSGELCFCCVMELEEYVSKPRYFLKTYHEVKICKFCNEEIPLAIFSDQIKIMKESLRSGYLPIKRFKSTCNKTCERHKHWKVSFLLPCSGEICVCCLNEMQSSLLNRQKCINCSEEIPMGSVTEQMTKPIKIEHGALEAIKRGGACKRHKHLKCIIRLPCSGEICFWCVVDMQEYVNGNNTFILNTRCEVKVCISCHKDIPQESFNDQINHIMQEVSIELMPICPVEKSKTCPRHKHWKSAFLLPCSEEVCFCCLEQMEQSRSHCQSVHNMSYEVIRCISSHCHEYIPLHSFKYQIKQIAQQASRHWCLQYTQLDHDCYRHGKCVHIRDSECFQMFCLSCLRISEKNIEVGDTKIRVERCRKCWSYIPVEPFLVRTEKNTPRSIVPVEKKDAEMTSEVTNAGVNCVEKVTVHTTKNKETRPVDKDDDRMVVTCSKCAQEVTVHITQNEDTKPVDQDDNKMVVTCSKCAQEVTDLVTEKRDSGKTSMHDDKKTEKKVTDLVTEKRDSDKTSMHDDKKIEKKLNDNGPTASTHQRQRKNHKSPVAMAATITRKEDVAKNGGDDIHEDTLCCKCTEKGTHSLKCQHRYCIGCLCGLVDVGKGDKKCEKCQIVTRLNDEGIVVPNRSLHTEVSSNIAGLWNIGATCYANCILQILGQTPGLINLLKSYTSTMKKGNTASLLLQILLDINSKRYQASTSDLDKLMEKVFKNDHTFRLFRQNDCHSFILSLFNLIEREETTTTTKSAGSACQCKTSQPASIFQGYMKNQFTFNTCEHTDPTEEQMFFSILVPVRKTKEQKWSVERGIESLLEIETFDDNDLPCRKCLNLDKNEADVSRTSTKKELLITKAPDILVLQLARFTEIEQNGNIYLSKNYQDVEFKDTLKLKTEGTLEEDYELYGVVMHAGSLAGGHYSSFVKKLSESSSQKWFYCSDSIVMKSDWNEVRSYGQKDAYLLFYTRQNSN